MIINATAPGKLILLGEYAVLEGAPAAVMAVDRTSQVKIQSRSNTFKLNAPTLNLSNLTFSFAPNGSINFPDHLSERALQQLQFFAKTVEFGGHNFGLKSLPPFEITMDTSRLYASDGAKIGFGSSAALTVAILGALAGYSGEKSPEAYNIFQLGLKAHHFAQDKLGSGIDVAASAFGGVLQYQIQPDADAFSAFIEPSQFPEDLNMIVIWTGESASTPALVKKVQSFQTANPKAYQKLIDHMEDTAFCGCHGLMNFDSAVFMDAVKTYHNAMEKLGQKSDAPIVSQVHQQLAKIATQFDCAYKPSGAGGGDIGIAFSQDQDALKKMAETVEKVGFEILPIQIMPEGLTVVEKPLQ